MWAGLAGASGGAPVVGQRIIARWTWGHGDWEAPATVVVVNRSSIRVRLEREVVYSAGDGWTLPAGHVIVLPRRGNAKWSQNNSAYTEDGRILE